jgi:DNA-binding IscR family transcriptional regulator
MRCRSLGHDGQLRLHHANPTGVVCPLHETWGAATAALRDTLAGTSLATLAARDEAIEAGTYPVPTDSHRPGAPIVDI